MINLKYTLALISIILALSTSAQKGINSIYSSYGIGDYRIRDPNAYTGMGNAGVALPSIYSINEINPASFGWLSKDRFVLDVGLTGLSTKYINDRTNISAADFGISRIALGMQVVNPVRTVVGLRRFSQVEYYTTANRQIGGSTREFLNDVEGNGGLYQLYLGNSIVIKNNLSIGINAGFVFGSVNTKETMALSETDLLIAESNTYYNHGTLSAGLQYQFKTGKSKWMAGAFFEPQFNFNVQEDNVLKNGNEEVIATGTTSHSKFQFPVKYGLGLSWNKRSFTATVDAIHHMWSKTGYSGNDFIAKDATSISLGIRHQFTRNTIWGDFPGIAIYGGFNYENSYLVINNKQLTSTSGTLGLTVSSKNNLNYYSVGLKVGTRGRPIYPLIKENFFEFSFSLAFSTFFQKERKYD